jgi:hypothetical protein
MDRDKPVGKHGNNYWNDGLHLATLDSLPSTAIQFLPIVQSVKLQYYLTQDNEFLFAVRKPSFTPFSTRKNFQYF